MFFWHRVKKTETIPTSHGTDMRLVRVGRKWEIHGNKGDFQSGAYMDGLWKRVLRTLPKRTPRQADGSLAPYRVLVLGVAMGGTFGLVLRRWPHARVTGVDWEPDFLSLGRRLGISTEDERVTFLAGDAAKVVPTLTGPFDLILVDLFEGTEDGVRVAQAARDPALQDACVRLLSPAGVLALNHYAEPDAADGWDAHFPFFRRLRFGANLITVYRRRLAE